MIKYALVCEAGHEFESWFPNSDAYDKQAKRGLVSCPVCNSAKVSKAIMAPQVARKDRDPAVIDASSANVLSATQQPSTQPMALLDERAVALREAVRELRAKIIENSVDVGEKFPEEARKMHDGDAPARSIHGKASLAEAQELIEEGIPLMPIPDLPDDRN
jgi:hypothetical protein